MSSGPAIWSDETQVNTTTSQFQGDGKAVALRGGGYVVVYSDASHTLSPYTVILGQKYDAQGGPVGDPVELSYLHDADQIAASVAATPGGGFAMTFVDTISNNVQVRVFDKNLGVVHGREQDFGDIASQGNPAIAFFGDRSYLVAYTKQNGGGDSDVMFRIVDPAGYAGPESELFNDTDISGGAEAASLSNGNVVVAFESQFAGSETDTQIYAKIVTSAGATAFRTVADSSANEEDPGVAGLTGGGFVVAWTHHLSETDSDIRFSIYDNALNPVGLDLTANTLKVGAQNEADVVALADGGFVVTWENDAADSVQAQRFDAAGNRLGPEYTVRSGVATDSPDAALLADGRIAYAIGGIGDGADVFTSIWDPRGLTVTGTERADTFVGRLEPTRIYGLAGNDDLRGMDGDDTLDGGDGRDTLIGGLGNDWITGGSGEDHLRGAAGADTLTGGLGNDCYYIDNANDRTIEAASGGIDTVFSQISHTLRPNIENLRLQTTAALNGNGNELNNLINGNSAANRLQGMAGNDRLLGNDGADTLIGGEGNDTLTGGSQADVFVFAAASAGADRIEDFNKINDRFDLSGGSFSARKIAGADTILTHNGGTVRIMGVTNLTLDQWNALVLPGGDAAGGPLLFRDWHDAPAARLQDETIHLGQGDWLFA